MDTEKEVLCEKIIGDIQAVFAKDPDICSFEIIPTTVNRNKSPVVHVDHNLGLESWCAKHVYYHAHKALLAHRYQMAGRKLVSGGDSVVKYLNVALLINPDVATCWNIRRQLVQKNHLTLHRELQFSALILSKKPKSSEAFAYRRWLFSFQSSESIDWQLEIGICERCADRSANNYHAWSHRQWVLQKTPYLIKSELVLSAKFIQKHISDYSAHHYRGAVIAKALEMFYAPAILELPHLPHLKELLDHYLNGDVQTVDDMLGAMLPNVDWRRINDDYLKSFLYCCNVVAHDIKQCDEQRKLYGARESFANHRRACLKFIVDRCVQLNVGDWDCRRPMQPCYMDALYANYDYTSNAFLVAVKRAESRLGDQQRRWCSVFLGFDSAL